MGKPADPRMFKIGDHGELRIPLAILEEAGLGPKMRVRFRVDGKTIVMEKAADGQNPLDGQLGKKIDKDLLEMKAEQDRERDRARDLFEKGLADVANDPDIESPEHPFRWD